MRKILYNKFIYEVYTLAENEFDLINTIKYVITFNNVINALIKTMNLLLIYIEEIIKNDSSNKTQV
ncbi:MAG: hypothetical protein Terrestrivirus2_76 [Terrestrivirus sp.]|uniref:Uncharacterized protein n=1 Tax=Terrestrivirus sp. TaxID=2487775 RepID=A0A3G4ZL55_9VIRU|nr:MAG: hypothetical protein Terrestrivirus2_76 [Terrestrivirus sp.]